VATRPVKEAAAPEAPVVQPKTVQPAPAPASSTKSAPAEKTTSAAKSKTVPKTSSGPAWVNRINFNSEDAGKSAVVIGTTKPVEYDLIRVSDRQLQLTLLNTKLPDYRKHALITTRFSSAVDRITPAEKKKNQTHFLIDMRETVPYTIDQTDNVIRMEFAASKVPPKPYEDAELPAWKKVVATGATEAPLGKVNLTSMKPEPEAPAEMSLAERLDSKLPGEKRYTGEKIALDFYDTDIKNVFRIIREISGKNFAIDKNVTGKVTLTLEKPVPWDQVLELVLKMNQLGMTMEGDIIRIATLSTLAQEEKLRQAKLKAEQQAKQQEEELEPLTTEYIPINYSSAQKEILPHLQNILTENRGKISVDERNNQIIFTDTAEKIQQAKEIVEQIDKVTPQVIIEARIVEANSNFVREIGFDWGTITLEDFDFGNVATFGPTSFTADNIPANFNNLGSIGFNFATLTGTTFSIVDAKIQAADVEGTTNIVSSPKIVTLDNKKAKIKQGFEVPYLERDSSGNATVNFKDVDLLLEVTPNVTPDDRIVMEIFVTKNDLVDPSADEPALSTNEAETEILVDDGDTIVIGGILKDTSSWAESGIPGLRQIPALGWLFKSNKTEERKNELLIFITPQIVKLQQRKLS
jgi:type IV pilus assembly protein PilQ